MIKQVSKKSFIKAEVMLEHAKKLKVQLGLGVESSLGNLLFSKQLQISQVRTL